MLRYRGSAHGFNSRLREEATTLLCTLLPVARVSTHASVRRRRRPYNKTHERSWFQLTPP